jgi:FkbM family methyltransferase
MNFDNLKRTIIEIETGRSRVFFHRDNRADNGVIQQIFVRKDYSVSRLARREEINNRYKSIIKSGMRPLIVDAGANIGASAVWFQSCFPDSLVLAIEPDDENASIAERNCYGLNAEIVRAAIGSEDGKVSIINPDAEPWSFRTLASDTGPITRISMTNLIADKQKEGNQPFIVKIDIEGGEEDLFSKNLDWLGDVPLIIIELHDWKFPKKGTSLPFLRAIASLNRDFVHIGENIFSINYDI